MPELPEVETVVRTLRPRLVGEAIRAVWSSGLALRQRRAVDEASLRRRCQGARVARRFPARQVHPHRPRAALAQSGHVAGPSGHDRPAAARERRRPTRQAHARGVDVCPAAASCASSMRAASAGWRWRPPLPSCRSLPRSGRTLSTGSSGKPSPNRSRNRRRPSSPSCSTSGRLPGSATSTRARLSFAPASIRARRPAGARGQGRRATPRPSARPSTLGIANCGTSFRDFVDANGDRRDQPRRAHGVWAPGRGLLGPAAAASAAASTPGARRSSAHAASAARRDRTRSRRTPRDASAAIGIGRDAVDAPAVDAEGVTTSVGLGVEHRRQIGAAGARADPFGLHPRGHPGAGVGRALPVEAHLS